MKKTLVLLLAILFLVSAFVPFAALAEEADGKIEWLDQPWIPTIVLTHPLIFGFGLLSVLLVIALIVKNKRIY